ncbi:uncharacterized protein [Haliotis cracherodii]|uniref:uncharacterized protein n=1 Tax=Haliotis cracherodii TaxID=6455 RepID=UPI0039EC075D
MAATRYVILVAIGMCATLQVTTSTAVRTPATAPGGNKLTPCGLCGRKIDVTLCVRNSLVKPYFRHTVEIKGMRQRQLIFFLEKAADIREEFRFTATYGQWGYFIDTINGLDSNYFVDETWWHIIDQNNESLPLGSSSYVPKNGQTITYEYVRGGPH